MKTETKALSVWTGRTVTALLLACWFGGVKAHVEQTSQTVTVPTDVTVTTTPFTATISWTGTAESYNVRCSEAAFLSEGFENSIDNWTLRDCSNNTGRKNNRQRSHSGYCYFEFASSDGSSDQYLISPELPGIPEETTLEFYRRSSTGRSSIRIGTSSNTNAMENFVWGSYINFSDGWSQYSQKIPAGTKYVCWQYMADNQNAVRLDDILIYYHASREWINLSTTENSVTFTGLTPYLTYNYQVQSVVGNETSEWTTLASFTTPGKSLEFKDVAVNDITSTTATISWTGMSESYNVRHRQTNLEGDVLLTEGFENGLNGWTRENYGNWTNVFSGTALPIHSGTSVFRFCYYKDGARMTTPQYLLSPELTDVPGDAMLEFWYSNCDINTESFNVGTSSTGTAVDDFTFGPDVSVSGQHWCFYKQAIPAGTKYVCLKYTSNKYNLVIDDIRIYTKEAWKTISTTESTVTITDLLPETEYEYQVQSVVGDNTSDWTAIATFTTLPFSGLMGDVNGDGSVTPADAIMILYHYFGVTQNGFILAAADLIDDHAITPADAIEALYIYFRASEH
jgi:hypothetical protein